MFEYYLGVGREPMAMAMLPSYARTGMCSVDRDPLRLRRPFGCRTASPLIVYAYDL